MRYPKRALISQILNRNRSETSALQLFGHTHAWYEPKSNFQLHESLDSFNRRQLERDVERRAVLRRSLDYSLPRTGVDVMRDERFLAELVNGDRFTLRQRMIGMHDQHQFVLEHRKRFEVAVDRLESHQGKIHLTVQHFAR